MALTISNTNTLTLLNTLTRNSAAQSATMTSLTTGKRINSGADDPAGLIAVSGLNAELTAVNASITNNQRTDSMLTVADGAIGEISSLLGKIEQLVVSSTSDATITDGEIFANQAQIDDALTAINRIVDTTNFNGEHLIDGTQAISKTGVDSNFITNVRVYSRSQATAATNMSVERVASAQTAMATFALLGGTGATSGTTTVAIAGSLGTATLTLASGSSQATIVGAINEAKAQTGVSAIQNASSIGLSSTSFGRDAFVSVDVISGGAINANYGTSTSDGDTTNDVHAVSKTSGKDAVIQINGQAAGTDGLDVVYNGGGVSLSFTLNPDFGSGKTGATTSNFSISADGGATFQLGTSTNTRQTIGIDSLATYNLGGGNGSVRLSELGSGGSAQLMDNPAGALESVRAAMAQVASIRGRLGGFQSFQVGSALRSMQAAQVGLTQAKSVIEDTDYAAATAKLNQDQVLIQSTISLLGIANQQAGQILKLL